VRIWTWFNWLMIWFRRGLLWTGQWNFGCHKRQKIWSAERLSVPQDRFCSVKLIRPSVKLKLISELYSFYYTTNIQFMIPISKLQAKLTNIFQLILFIRAQAKSQVICKVIWCMKPDIMLKQMPLCLRITLWTCIGVVEVKIQASWTSALYIIEQFHIL
jgi:hypothetical protein